MIKILEGIHETIDYGSSSKTILYHNDEYESYPLHWHYGIELIMPVRNNYTVTVSNTNYLIPEGGVLIINSGVVHSMSAPPNGERIILQFDLSVLNNSDILDTLLTILPPALFFTPNDSAVYKAIKKLMNKIVLEYDNQNPFREAAIDSYLLQLFVLIGRLEMLSNQNFAENSSSKQHEYIECFLQVCNYINKHYAEDLSLDQVAEMAGFSKYHFLRLFKNFSNMTFNSYLTQTRINFAKKCLLSTDRSITDICEDSGFSTLGNFERSFKKVTGYTPKEYRTKHFDSFHCSQA